MDTDDLLDAAGRAMHFSEVGTAYATRHGIASAPTLTIKSDEVAAAVVAHLKPKIQGKVVVDVGGGTGIMGMHLAEVAKKVFVIEANPIWTAAWIELYHRRKPRNLNFLFGTATEFVGIVEADVALVLTHSGLTNMMTVARQLATEAIDVYGAMVEANPAAFDAWAREARLKT